MPNRVSKIFQYLRAKLSSFLGFVKFLVIPQNKYLRATLIGVVFVFVFGSITIVYAAPDPDFFDQIINLLNVLLFWIASGLGWIAMKIFGVIIWISSYNNFVTSPAVTKGWVLVRDVCNMFFVVILLVIAFAQILGVQKYSMKTLLPKVLIAAVLVNFSKLICGLLIDMAQVVMMTFVNGYQATAGANLIQGLGLTKLLKLSDDATSGSGGTGPKASEIFVAMLIACFIILATIFVAFFIALLLIMRVVTLWILVVLSPAAFMLSTVPFGAAKAGQWWQKFGWTVAVGPFMAFFLWLSLLIMSDPEQMMGGGTLADSAAAIQGSSSSSGGEASVLGNIAQAAIGLAMLMASLIAAQEAGGAMGSLAQTGQKATAGALKKTAMKVSGASAVKDRGLAAAQGWQGRSAARKAAVMDKWQQRGAGAHGLKSKVASKVKDTTAKYTGVSAAKGAIVAANRKRKQQKTVRKEAVAAAKLADPTLSKEVLRQKGQDAVNKLQQNEGGMWASAIRGGKSGWDNVGVGGVDTRMATEAKKENLEKRRTAAEANLKGSNIKTKDQKDSLLESPQTSKRGKDMQRAALLSLAESGELSEHHGEMGRDMFKGDDDGLKAFQDSMKKKQAHLAYGDLSNPETARELADDIDSGDVDLAKMDQTSYADTNFMAAAHKAVGGKRFSSDVEKASKRSSKHKDAISDTVGGEAFATSILQDVQISKNDLDAATAESRLDPTNTDKAQRVVQAQKTFDDKNKAQKNSGKMVAKITGDGSKAFGKRKQKHDPAGEGYDVTLTDDQIGQPVVDPSTGEVEIDEAALATFINGANAKTLNDFNVGANVQAQVTVSKTIKTGKLKSLAKSSEDGAQDKMSELITQMSKTADNRSNGMDPAERAKILNELEKALQNEDIDQIITDEARTAYETAYNNFTAPSTP
jgi:hypothetical protein